METQALEWQGSLRTAQPRGLGLTQISAGPWVLITMGASVKHIFSLCVLIKLLSISCYVVSAYCPQKTK